MAKASSHPIFHWVGKMLSKEKLSPVLGRLYGFGKAVLRAGFSRFRELGDSPVAALMGGVLYLMGTALILFQPRLGVYLILFFTLIGDSVLIPWYPFVKGFSSHESLFFLHDAFIISPLETYIWFVCISWLARQARPRWLHVYQGPLFWPTMVFLGLVLFGFAYGLGTGGSLHIALWEMRSLFYLGVMMVLVGNLLDRQEHANHVMWVAMVALFIKGIYSSLYYLLELNGDLNGVQGISEHAAAIHLNTLFIFSLAVWLYKSFPAKRFVLPLMIPFVIVGYIAMQRRAAFITLFIALALMVAVLYKEQRQLFWVIVPMLAGLSLIYVTAVWNSQGLYALPAQAIKSVIAANQASDENQLSNHYRVLENKNISFTIHKHPLTGVGFGQKFHIVVPMPDISWFVWWEYITHDSIMWMWMKAGVGGFFSLLFLVGLTITVGIRELTRLTSHDMKAIILTATLYIVMHFIYANVDMSWDAQSMVYVGTMMGLVNGVRRIGTRLPATLSSAPHPQSCSLTSSHLPG